MRRRYYLTILLSSFLTSGMLLLASPTQATAAVFYDYGEIACGGNCSLGGSCTICLSICIQGSTEDLKDECDEIITLESNLFDSCDPVDADIAGFDCTPTSGVNCQSFENQLYCDYTEK